MSEYNQIKNFETNRQGKIPAMSLAGAPAGPDVFKNRDAPFWSRRPFRRLTAPGTLGITSWLRLKL
jgi:hypothetical protein